MGVVSFMTGNYSANLEDDDVASFLLEVVVANVAIFVVVCVLTSLDTMFA